MSLYKKNLLSFLLFVFLLVLCVLRALRQGATFGEAEEVLNFRRRRNEIDIHGFCFGHFVMHQCINVFMYQCVNKFMHQCVNKLMYQCVHVFHV